MIITSEDKVIFLDDSDIARSELLISALESGVENFGTDLQYDRIINYIFYSRKNQFDDLFPCQKLDLLNVAVFFRNQSMSEYLAKEVSDFLKTTKGDLTELSQMFSCSRA